MKNMGLSRLRLAAPPAIPDEGVIRARAVHAADLWEKAECFDSLEAAVGDCALVIGVTRRMGQRRKDKSIIPGEAAACLKAHGGPAALVFGNERTGLEDRELRVCSLASHIPAAGEFPSLNLSHAVQVYAYELFLALDPGPENPPVTAPGDRVVHGGRMRPLDQVRLEALAHVISDSLALLGFYKQPGREDQERFFRDIFSRAALTPGEAKYVQDIFAKAARLATKDKG
jgi:tRNA/rRNA methyltransferase/tRNA (cytidine32/uridine32-2'-O)-methyltransferase